MQVEWDPSKAIANLKKHGVTFEEAFTVLTQVGTVTFYQEDPSEDRWVSMGYSAAGRLLLVVYCERKSNLIRIISARRATSRERKDYEEGI